MKRIFLFLSFLLPTLLSCQIKADNWFKSIIGNGNVTKETRKVESFDGIKASAGVNVFLFQGDEEKIVVEADDNLHNCIITEVKGSTLYCYIDCKVHFSKKMNVYVNYKKLNKINASSGSDISGETLLKTEMLNIDASSGANIKLEIDAQSVSCDVSSGSDVILKGTIQHFQGSASSGADIKANDLTTKTCDVNVSSAGNIQITATDKIKASASSGGDVTYFGNPEVEHISESSGGDVTHR